MNRADIWRRKENKLLANEFEFIYLSAKILICKLVKNYMLINCINYLIRFINKINILFIKIIFMILFIFKNKLI